MKNADDGCPSLRSRCPIDLAILSRWFLEHDAGPGETDAPAAALPDAERAQEVAA